MKQLNLTFNENKKKTPPKHYETRALSLLKFLKENVNFLNNFLRKSQVNVNKFIVKQ